MPNIEIKARYPNLDQARITAKTLGAKFLWSDEQIDTYFNTKDGKLKLRESGLNGSELLPYKKTDEAGLKKSDYAKIPIIDPNLVKKLFDGILGRKVQVKKKREVYMHDNVRIHLDQVESLGNFLEFEAVFEVDTPEIRKREREKVAQLMGVFKVSHEELLEDSYPDLLIHQGGS